MLCLVRWVVMGSQIFLIRCSSKSFCDVFASLLFESIIIQLRVSLAWTGDVVGQLLLLRSLPRLVPPFYTESQAVVAELFTCLPLPVRVKLLRWLFELLQ